MAISSDWDVDFVTKVISHIDGTLAYDTNGGTAPSNGDYIRGATSGAVAKILSGGDGGGAGTFTLTSVTGQFENNESLEVLDSVDFDTVANGGFIVGDTLEEQTTGTRQIIVDAIEYNFPDGGTAGTGTIYGRLSGTNSIANNDQLDIVSPAARAQANVALAASAETSGANFTGALADGTLTPPTTSIIINFDSPGSPVAVPRFAAVQNTGATATGIVQKIYGVAASGSLRLVDVTGTWADDDNILVTNKLNYTNLQAGQSFKIGDKVVGKSGASGTGDDVATGKIIEVDLTNSRLTLQNSTDVGGFDWTDATSIVVRTTTDTYVADVLDTTFTYDHNIDVNGSPITEQLATQGGIYPATAGSLNIVRDANELYTLLQDTFDELGALDDDVPMTAQVLLQQYTLVNGWKIPDLSFRFVESGSIQDETLDNIWTNYQTLGTVAGIGDDVYAATTPLPQFYIEQNASVVDQWWYYGHIDILVKVKTNTAPAFTEDGDGEFINSGTVTIFNRNYTDTYDHFETTTIAGVAPVPLATSDDLNNATGTHEFDYTLNAGTFVVGEEIVDDLDNTKRGIITAVNTGPDNLEFVQTGATAFASADDFTGQFSGATGTAGENQQNLVAGYTSRIIIATVDFTVPGTLTSGTFVGGELLTSSGAGEAIFMHINAAEDTLYIGNASSDFSIAGTQTLTGATSGAIFTASAGTSDSDVVPKDIGDGGGEVNYNAVIFLNRDDQADGDTLAHMYEWVKYRTRSYETGGEPPTLYNLIGGPGTASGYQGRLYITLDSTYPLVKASPLGTFAGGTFFGARGVFVQDMADSDIRNFQLIDAAGTVRNPPSLQTLQVTGLVSGDRVAVFRLTGAGGTIDTSEYLLDTEATDHNGSGDTVIQVTTELTADTPSTKGNSGFTGVVRVYNATTQLYDSYDYSDVTYASPGRFTGISPALTQNYIAGDNVYVPLIQREADASTESVNIEFVANIPILTRVRRKGILPFEAESTFTSTGASPAAIRSFDSIVD